MKNNAPTSRATLLPALAGHLGSLATSVDRVDPKHREADAPALRVARA